MKLTRESACFVVRSHIASISITLAHHHVSVVKGQVCIRKGFAIPVGTTDDGTGALGTQSIYRLVPSRTSAGLFLALRLQLAENNKVLVLASGVLRKLKTAWRLSTPMSQYCVVITTTASKNDAEKIIKALLSEKLAACIQVHEIKSYYTWKDKVNEDPEQILLIKAKADLYPEIEASIKQNHTYEVPEIVQLPILNGSAAYLNWIEEVSKS